MKIFGESEKKYESRVRERMLNPKQLGAKCSIPHGLALLEKRREISEGELATVALRRAVLLSFILPVFIIVLLINANSVFALLIGLVIAALIFLLVLHEIRQFRARHCILMGEMRCCLARVKDYYEPYADIEFANGHTESRLFVCAADGRPVKPGDEVYVCVIECKDIKNMQFCEVRPVAELEKVPDRKSRKNQMR